MAITADSIAEKHAAETQNLRAFGGFNLLHTKREVAKLLALIGSNGIFDEYTKHDISHIDEMLELLTTTIIPVASQKLMTPADWLMIVLGVYFHDLGMLVTKFEYQRRDESGFPDFRAKLLTDDDQGKDYQERVGRLEPDERERFLYQEFVRDHHAHRIRSWVVGSARDDYGITHNTAEAIEKLLSPLGTAFRQDLGTVCESHHLDDLDNFKKYRTSQPYGTAPQEAANIHYSAILLRTADLLHMTADRTPSIVFKVISPSNPISQREWAKQSAVRSVRSQPAKDKDGNIDVTLPRDTIEVHATFTDEEGFFGLTAFLDYAEQQLKQSNEWAVAANKTQGVQLEFPWRQIDQSFINTIGFEKDTLEFKIDTVKVLNLLTGHTLYNDTGVVLRELVQNAIDAVRLQFFDPVEPEGRSIRKHGLVQIEWDSPSRTLVIRDNGTGMSEQIIRENLLKVGASRYQSSRFKDDHPQFTPISRFGIGVLSTFMIADEVEFVTMFPGDDFARRLLLRTVHGKYLVRLLEKSEPRAARLQPHGTEVSIKIRPSARIGNILELAKHWIVVPECRVTARIDGGAEVDVGYLSARDALIGVLQTVRILGGHLELGKNVDVIEKEKDGIAVAYAVEWSSYFQEWSFIHAPIVQRRNLGQPELGICVEGIRVDNVTPGFMGNSIYAIVNARGKNAPRTNVARSGLDGSEDLSPLMASIYAVYCDHVKEEVQKLQAERSFSLTWAAGEATYLLSGLSITGGFNRGEFRDPTAFQSTVSALPILLVEKGGRRSAMSADELCKEEFFWTVDGDFFRSIEKILREVPENGSVHAIASVLSSKYFDLPDGPLLCQEAFHQELKSRVFDGREVSQIRANSAQRRVDLKWVNRATPPVWISPYADWSQPSRRVADLMESRARPALRYRRANIKILSRTVEISGLEGEFAVRVQEQLFLLSSPIQEWFAGQPASPDSSLNDLLWIVLNCVEEISSRSRTAIDAIAIVEKAYSGLIIDRSSVWDIPGAKGLQDALRLTTWKVFDTSFWQRDNQLQ